MKRIKIIFLLVPGMLIFLSGCNKVNYNVKEEVIKEDIIYKLDVKLNENSLKYNKIKTESNDQNAKGCYYYYFEKDNPIVIYIFDEESSEYKKIVNDGGIYKPNSPKLIEANFHKGLVIPVNNSLYNYDDIINIINSL